MLHIIYGTDQEKKINAREALIARIKKDKNPTEVLSRTDIDASITEIESLAGSTSLFGEQFIIVLDGVFANTELYEWLSGHVELLAHSQNHFILIEQELTKAKVMPFAKQAKTVENFDAEKIKKEKFNLFSLTDAFGARDKKQAWLIYRAAIEQGIAPQEISGVLFWIVKTMLLITVAPKRGETGTNLGLNPFVLRKAQTFVKKWNEDELKECSRSLLRIYHECIYDTDCFETKLEAYILAI